MTVAHHPLELRDGIVAALLRTFLAHPINGCLTVQGPNQAKGQIHIHQGRVVHAESGPFEGLPALAEMLTWRAGIYSLDEAAPLTQSISLNLEQLQNGVVQLTPIQALPSLEALLNQTPISVPVPLEPEYENPLEPEHTEDHPSLEHVMALEAADDEFNQVWDQPSQPRGFFGWFMQVIGSIQQALDGRRTR